MVHHDRCPACKSKNLRFLFDVTDHAVSRKSFAIWQCDDCSLRITQDAPIEEDISVYYQSEDYISHTDTRKGLVSKVYHIVRSYTLRKKMKQIQQWSRKRKGTLLDIGCGTGSFLQTMQDGGWRVTGLEPDDTARSISKKKNLEVHPSYEIYHLKNTFDVISMWHVLEHIHELRRYLEKVHSLLSPGGIFVVAVPNYTSSDQQHYGKFWAAYDVPRHLYHFSPVAMEKLMKSYGFRVIKRAPMWFDSFYVSLLSEKYRRGSALIIPAFIQGLRANLSALFNTKKCSSVIYVMQKPTA